MNNIATYITPDTFDVYAVQNRYDPTRTITLRNRFARAMRTRFNELTKVIRQGIVEQDVFGLQVNQMNPPMRGQFDFPRSPDKVRAFMEWLNRQVDRGILEVGRGPQMGQGVDPAWTNLYVNDSYKRGLQRARYELRRSGYNVPTLQDTGGMEVSMGTPFHMDRVGVLYTRVYEDLKGITSQMSTQISRVLSQGMVDGDNPRLLARKLVSVINGGGAELGITDTLGRYMPARRRSEILARTEVIRAHHTAMVQEYRNWGAVGVRVLAEWATAGDDRVCAECANMDGNVYTLDQIQNMIPRHPQCRCIALPITRKDNNEI